MIKVLSLFHPIGFFAEETKPRSSTVGIMAFVTDMYEYVPSRSKDSGLPFCWQGCVRLAAFIIAAILAGSWIMTAVGALETIILAYAPVAPVMRRIPLALGEQIHSPSQVIRQSFIKAYTAQSAYSNLDWRRKFTVGEGPIIADIGPESVIEATPLADFLNEKVATLKTTALAYATALQSAEKSRTAFVERTVPLPGKKPFIATPRKQSSTRLADAAETSETNSPGRRLFGPSHSYGFGNRVAVYDIAAATVYMPNGERLEAHSGLGVMRDNPSYVKQKNRGATPPHTYNLRMREALFHGVEAIRLTPVDGTNRYNRDGLLAHTFMLGRRGDSNGCVVFRDYARFLRAFKRGDVKQLVVVPHMPAQNSARIASLF